MQRTMLRRSLSNTKRTAEDCLAVDDAFFPRSLDQLPSFKDTPGSEGGQPMRLPCINRQGSSKPSHGGSHSSPALMPTTRPGPRTSAPSSILDSAAELLAHRPAPHIARRASEPNGEPRGPHPPPCPPAATFTRTFNRLASVNSGPAAVGGGGAGRTMGRAPSIKQQPSRTFSRAPSINPERTMSHSQSSIHRSSSTQRRGVPGIRTAEDVAPVDAGYYPKCLADLPSRRSRVSDEQDDANADADAGAIPAARHSSRAPSINPERTMAHSQSSIHRSSSTQRRGMPGIRTAEDVAPVDAGYYPKCLADLASCRRRVSDEQENDADAGVIPAARHSMPNLPLRSYERSPSHMQELEAVLLLKERTVAYMNRLQARELMRQGIPGFAPAADADADAGDEHERPRAAADPAELEQQVAAADGADLLLPRLVAAEPSAASPAGPAGPDAASPGGAARRPDSRAGRKKDARTTHDAEGFPNFDGSFEV